MKALVEISNDIAFVSLLPFLAIALATDVSRRRIPNLLIVYMLCCGVVLQAALAGPSGLITALGGVVTGLIMLFPFYAFGGMGAGDVKLLAAAGAFLGPDGALYAGALTLGAGGMLALAVLAWRAAARLARGRWPSSATLQPASAAKTLQLPYSVAIAAGTLIAAYNTSGERLVSWVSP